MIRILNAEPLDYSETARQILRDLGEVVEQPLSRNELQRALPDYDVLIVRLAHQVDRELLDAGTKLKAIVSATTGLDHIDVDYAATKGIAVLCLRGEVEFLRTVHATAEHTWALLLALRRRIPQAFEAVKRGEWSRDAYRGHELDGKRLGILGLGRLGRRIARYGLAFDMRVFAFDPHVEEWVDGIERVPSLHALLSSSDVLSIHVPLNAETRGLIGVKEFALLPYDAILVNTSRGEVVDSSALLAALTSGRLGGAALDVVPYEREACRRDADTGLINFARYHDNLLVTPHIAGATYESMAKTEEFMARKLAKYFGESN